MCSSDLSRNTAGVSLTAVFLLYFLLRKDFRAAATTVVTGLVATAIGFLLSWHGSLRFWFGGNSGARSVSGSPYYQNQTVDAMLARLSLPRGTQTLLWLAIVAVLFVVAAIAIQRAHRAGNRALALSLTACLGLMASPTSWGHHWVYVVPAAITVGALVIKQRARWAYLAGVAVFVVGPYRLLPVTYQHWEWWQHVVDNSYIIVGTMFLVLFALRKPTLDDDPLVRATLYRAT